MDKSPAEHVPVRGAGRWAWLLVLVIPVLLWPLAMSRNGPGAPLPTSAPEDVFSGWRARAELEDLLDGVGPHPVGTRAAAVVRGRLIERLEALGLSPRVQDTWVISGRGWATRVRNVWATLPAEERGSRADRADGADAILLLCHYDSVGAGPGAGDDGSGVACMLEVTRALLASDGARGARAREVILLFDEAEEDGLFGAKAFLAEHPAAARVGVVVNIEARGTEGASIMFETGRDNAGLIGLYADVTPRPMANSLTGEAYRRMPNSTDLSLFLERGIAGYNFAFIGGGSRYHTDRDDLAHLSTAALQHQGESVLALVRALAAAPDLEPITHPQRSPLVYTSLLGATILSWPEPLSVWLALLALAPVLLVLRRGRRFGVFRWRQLFLAAPVAGIFLLMPVAVDYGLYRALLSMTDLPVVSTAHELLGLGPARVLFLAAGLLPLLVVGPFLATLARPLALWGAVGIVLALASLAAGVLLPAVSFVTLLPAFVLAASGPFLRADPRSLGAIGVAPVLAAASLLWIPMALTLEAAFGLTGGFVWGGLAGLWSLLVAPLFAEPLFGRARRKLLGAVRLLVILIAALSFRAVLRLPNFSEHVPSPLNLACYYDGKGARWLLNDYGQRPDEPLLRAGGFDVAPQDLWLPGAASPWLAGASADWSPTPPRLEVLSESPLADEDGTGRRLRLLLTPGTGGDVTTLRLAMAGDTPLAAISVAGRDVPVNGARRRRHNGGLHVYGIRGSGEGPVELELEFEGRKPVGITILEQTLGLPACGEGLLRDRAPHRAPLQGGDRSITVAFVTI